MSMSQLDPGQILKTAFDDAAGAIKVEVTSGSSTSTSINDGTIPTQKAAVNSQGELSVEIGDSAGNKATITGTALDVNLASSSGSLQVTQATGSNLHTVVDSGTLAATQSGTWNITNVSGTVSLPTGAATAAKQPALGTAGSASADVISVQGVASMTALKVDGSAVTQPVSAASLPLPSGASTAAKQPALGVSGTASSDVLTVQGITGMTAITVDGSASTQPVSGTVTVTQGTGTNLHTVIDSGTVAATQSGTWNITNVSGTVSLPTGASIAAKQPALGTAGTAASDVITVQGIASMTALKVDGSAVTQPISGTITANIGTTNGLALDSSLSTIDTDIKASQPRKLQDGSGNAVTSQVNGAQRALDVGVNVAGVQVDPRSIRALTSSDVVSAAQSGTWNINNVSGSVSLPTGASTSAKQPALGIAGTASSDVITVQGVASMTALKVDGSAVTQPVSGTVTVTQATGTSLHAVIDSGTVAATQSGTWNITNVSGTVSLPTGASTSAKQPALGTAGTASSDVITIQGIASMTALKVDGSAVTQPVSGTVTANAGTNLNTSALALNTTVAALQVAQGSTTSGEQGTLIQGAVTTSSPSYTTAQTSPLSLTTAGALRTDASATTQPVSGTVTANAGTGNFTVTQGTGTNLHAVIDSGTLAATQSGTWSTRTQDGSGTAITSTGSALDINLKTSSISINTAEAAYTLAEFARNDYSSVNVTTSAYVTLIASTASAYKEIQIFDSSGQTLKLAVGAAASEVDKIIITPGGTFPIRLAIASGTRISLKAISATANVGEIDVQLLG